MKICYSKVRKTPERGGRRMRFIKILIAGRKELKVLDQVQLKGTPLYGKHVTYNLEGELYIDGERALDPISIVIGTVVGWLINGIVIYATGYSGDQLAAYTIKACWELSLRVSSITTIYLLSPFASKPRGYKTKTGQQCTINASGNAYTCAYSI